MTIDLRGRSFLKEADFTKPEFEHLINQAELLREEKRAGSETPHLEGRNIALVFEKTSTRTRSAFEVAAHDQGAHVTYIGPEDSQLGRKESIADTARVLGRMFDGIEYRGAAHERVEILARFAEVPVWNGLTDQWHPTQMLADVLTMLDHGGKPIEDIAYCYVGDARNNTANSLLVTGALLGADVRLAAPQSFWPAQDVRDIADRLAVASGARLLVTDEIDKAVRDVDFVYTDVWLSMGEPEERWADRISELSPFQLNASLLEKTHNPSVKVLHCLPALHNRDTEVGEMVYEKWGLEALEITDDVFESDASVVFDQAENRLHTIKAIMVSTLAR